MKINVPAKLAPGGSFVYTRAGPLVHITELLQEVVVRLAELQSVQAIAGFRRQLDRRELSDTLYHGPRHEP